MKEDVPPESIKLACHGQRMVLIAESALGRRVARRVEVDRGIPIAVYRCGHCKRLRHEGWIPPTWINAIDRCSAEIRTELNLALALDAQAAFTEKTKSGNRARIRRMSGLSPLQRRRLSRSLRKAREELENRQRNNRGVEGRLHGEMLARQATEEDGTP